MENKSILDDDLRKHLKDAEDSVLKWHEDTFNALKKQPRRSDLILMGALLVAKKHTLAVLTLIRERHLLPAQALIRVLLELHIKLQWIMCDIKVRTKENDDKIYLKLRQLDKNRVEEHIKLVNNLCEIRFPKKNETLAELNRQLNEYKNMGIKKSPNIASICKELDKCNVYGASNNKESWSNMIYPECYQEYSSVIHSDLGLIRKFVINDDDKKIIYYEDIAAEPKKLIEHALNLFADINKLFLNYFKMKDE